METEICISFPVLGGLSEENKWLDLGPIQRNLVG
jgi:hypothetical protein